MVFPSRPLIGKRGFASAAIEAVYAQTARVVGVLSEQE